MTTKEQMAAYLIERYQKEDMQSRLDREQFCALFREAVKDFYPKLKKMYADQTIYGISIEIGDVVQSVYKDSFVSYFYLNTEEQYQEQIKDCEEDEESDYRFGVWSEWEPVETKSELFEKLQDYLTQNSLYECTVLSSPSELDYQKALGDAAVAWYNDNSSDFEDAFDEECSEIRLWMAEALGELRKEGFWEKQGNAELYVIPFDGECEIETEELIETFLLMDAGCHGTEYIDYLESCDS